MSRRFLGLLLLVAASNAGGQALTEAAAVDRGLSQPNVLSLLSARRQENAGNVAAAGRWDNPQVEYSRETLDSAAGNSEDDFLWIRQRINIAGVKGLERDSAAQSRIAADADVDMLEREFVADVRRLFYSTIAAERDHAARLGRQARLQQIAVAIRERVQAGDASRYDQLRIERELALLDGERFTAEARATASRDRLFSRIGGEHSTLAGVLLPPPAEETAVADVLANHPELVALAAEAESASLAAEAAGRERWPELTFGVGQRDFSQPGVSGDGDLYMLGVEVPLFDRGDGRRRAASGRQRARQAEYAIAADNLAAQLRATTVELQARREAAMLLSPDGETTESLSDIAEAAYDAGEIGVIELIDAHRADLELQTEHTARAMRARESFIQLQLLRGQP